MLHTTHDSPCPNNFSSLLFSAAALCKKGNGEANGWVSAGTKTQARSSSCCYFCTVGKERNPQSSASTSASDGGGYPRPLLSSQGEKNKMETTTDMVEENRTQEIIHSDFYTIYLFLFEAGWVGGWLGVVSGSARLESRGNQFFVAETKNRSKNWRSNFVVLFCESQNWSCFFPQTPKPTYKKQLWKLAVQ